MKLTPGVGDSSFPNSLLFNRQKFGNDYFVVYTFLGDESMQSGNQIFDSVTNKFNPNIFLVCAREIYLINFSSTMAKK